MTEHIDNFFHLKDGVLLDQVSGEVVGNLTTELNTAVRNLENKPPLVYTEPDTSDRNLFLNFNYFAHESFEDVYLFVENTGADRGELIEISDKVPVVSLKLQCPREKAISAEWRREFNTFKDEFRQVENEVALSPEAFQAQSYIVHIDRRCE